MMRKLAVLAGLALVLAMVFAAGVLVGQHATPAKAQTATVEERAAAIKAELVDSITRYHATLPKDMLDALALTYNTSLLALYAKGSYVGGLAMAARDDTLLGQYARYVLPAANTADKAVNEAILEDSFLDRFSFSIAKYGLPPAMPPLTDAELSRADSGLRMAGKAWLGDHPHAQGLLGR